MIPARFVGGPLDGQTRDVDAEAQAVIYTQRIVHRYDWAGGNSFVYAGSATTAIEVDQR